MCRLSREIVLVLVAEFGPAEVLRRLSDPFWFQAFGCVLGFDWHSSGVTTTVCGALKEGLKGLEAEAGFFVAGGKGRASRRTPEEIEIFCDGVSLDAEPLIYASRMSAKVDSAALQDGYRIYHHAFFFTDAGDWCVVQQGMREADRTARRYHWLGSAVEDFVCEPHTAVCCDNRSEPLNLVAEESEGARHGCTEAAAEGPARLCEKLKTDERKGRSGRTPQSALILPARHRILLEDLDKTRLKKTLLSVYERRPENFETLLGLRGVGPKTLRALSLVAEILYGQRASFRDPARFSFAHGGKDGTPFPVDRATYDRTIDLLHRSLLRARIQRTERVDALRRLHRFWGEDCGA
jgi:hypothetical protein